jgi:hypothetical protein
LSLLDHFQFLLGLPIYPVSLELLAFPDKLTKSVPHSRPVLSFVVVVFLPSKDSLAFVESVLELPEIEPLVSRLVFALPVVESLAKAALVSVAVLEDDDSFAIEFVLPKATVVGVGVGGERAADFVALPVLPVELNLVDFFVGEAVEFALAEAAADKVAHTPNHEPFAFGEVVLEDPEVCIAAIEEFSVPVFLSGDEKTPKELPVG